MVSPVSTGARSPWGAPRFGAFFKRREPKPDATTLSRMADEFLRAADERQHHVEAMYETPPPGISREDHLFDLASDWASHQALENDLFRLSPSLDGLLDRYRAVQAQMEKAKGYPESAQLAWQQAAKTVQLDLGRLTGELFTDQCLQPEANAFDMPAVEQRDGSLNPDFLQPGNTQPEQDIPDAIPMDYIEARRFVGAILEHQGLIPEAGRVIADLFRRIQQAKRDYGPMMAYEFLLEEAQARQYPRAVEVALLNATAASPRAADMIRKSFSEFDNTRFDHLDWKNNPVGAGVNYLKARSVLDRVLGLMTEVTDAPGLDPRAVRLREAFAEVGGKIDGYWQRLCTDRMTGEDAERLWSSMSRLPDTPGVKAMRADLQRLSAPFRVEGLD